MWWRRRDRDVEKELRFHIDSQEQENLRSGMTPDEARRQALLMFGGPTQIREECGELATLHWLQTVAADLRYAARSLRSSPVFTAAAVLSLALGIGANAAIFTLLHAALWKPLPVPRPAELFHLVRSDGADDWSYSWPLFRDLREAAAPYGRMFARGSAGRRRFRAGSGEETAIGETVSADYFTALEIRPHAGRLFDSRDERDPQSLAVLSYAFWTRRFHSDPFVVGRTVDCDETPYRVIGVAQEGFRGIEAGLATDVWLPVQVTDKRFVKDGASSNWLSAVLRTTDVHRAQAAVEGRFERYINQVLLPKASVQRWIRSLKMQRIRLRPAAGGLASEGRPYERALLVLLGIVAVVLLICCANVANLLLARNLSRRREIAVRIALGAGRARLASQLLCESLVLALSGTLAGIALGVSGSGLLLRLLPPSHVPLDFDVRPDATVLALAALMAIVTTLLCGAAPVWRAWKPDSLALYQAGMRVTGRSLGRKVLVAGQLALSLVLIAGAGLFLKTLYRLAETDLGFRPERILTFDFSFPSTASKEHQAQVMRSLLEAVTGRDGISATFSTNGVYEHGGWSRSLDIVDGRRIAAGVDTEVQMESVGPRYFEILGISLLAGRTFAFRDDKAHPAVAVVNEAFVRRFLGGVSPVGHAFDSGSMPPVTVTIVGVVRDVRHMGVKERPWPAVYLPALQLDDGLGGTLLLRSSLSEVQASRLVQQELARVDGSVQIAYEAPLQTVVNGMISRERLVAYLSSAFGALAILLAAIGLYGVMAYNMSRRTAEIAIRVALGARPGDIRRMALGDAMQLTLVGLLAGIPVALAAGRLARGLLDGVSALDPWLLGIAALLMTGVGLIAGWIPATRAARIDPNTALKIG